jgi:hypothetical protein
MTTTRAIIVLWSINRFILLIPRRSSRRPNRNQDISSEHRITTGARLPLSHPGELYEPPANALA